MKKTHLLLALMPFAFINAAEPSATVSPQCKGTQKPNILFLVVDDLRPELGCYGKSYIRTPNIDALASNGLVFDRAYVQQAVCSPSRTVVMTGVRPDTSKVWDLVTHFRVALPNVMTLGQCLQTNGYWVQGMGKIYHMSETDPPTWSLPPSKGADGKPLSQDEIKNWCEKFTDKKGGTAWVNPKAETYALPANAALVGKVGNVSLEPDGMKGDNSGADLQSYWAPASSTSEETPAASASQGDKGSGKKGKKKKGDVTQGTAGGDEGGKANIRGPIYECTDVPDNTYTDGRVADLAIDALKGIASNPDRQPFFLAVGFVKPHLPWVAPKKYWDMYDSKTIDLAPNQFLPKDAPDYAVNPNDGEFRAYKGVPPSGKVPEAIQRKLKQAYFAGVSYTDAQVGKVIAELKSLGLAKNTIIILWGDHGWKLGEHSAWGKHTNVENDVNAPLIISVPGMKNPGTHSEDLVEFVDIYPTLCELAGIPKPGHLEGLSFSPVIDDPKTPWKSAAFSQYPRPSVKTLAGPLMGYTMRTERYRFTIWVGRDDHSKVDAIEVYDHKTDPQENTNIAKKPENAHLVQKLRQQWEKGWQAAMPTSQP